MDSTRRGWVADRIRDLLSLPSGQGGTFKFTLPTEWAIDLYLHDESDNATGSLKHRLARSLFLYGLVNGLIDEKTTIVEASSGSTAVSEAHFAKTLGLPFVTVVPSSTSPVKIEAIHQYGGECILVDDPASLSEVAEQICMERNGYFMDQFRNAAHATDWRSDNVATEILQSLTSERFPEPEWIVVGVGTGGTATTIGRHLRYSGVTTRVAICDPEGSAYFPFWAQGDTTTTVGSRIEGIGRPRTEPAFQPNVVEAAIQVPDFSSIAAMRVANQALPFEVGGSTGTNLAAALFLVADMVKEGRSGSVVTLICDRGDRYSDSYYNPMWLEMNEIDPGPSHTAMSAFLDGDLDALETLQITGIVKKQNERTTAISS